MSEHSLPTAERRSLQGARVLVVGASGGIGRPLVAALEARGAVLAVAARDTDRLADRGVGARAVLPFDLADDAAAPRLVATASEALGGLDGVVCCAGAVAFGPLDETPLEVLHELVAVDLVGPLLLARAAIPHLAEGGFVLNVSGVIAELPTAGLVPYSAVKAGVSAGFRALAREVRSRGVSVIDARPPHTETGLAGRPLHGTPPRMRPGLDPATVADRLVEAIERDERDVPARAFTP
jgi:NAD(P)-dependent dehydrogenase (short-subunit alcohol dehydrogenase family)